MLYEGGGAHMCRSQGTAYPLSSSCFSPSTTWDLKIDLRWLGMETRALTHRVISLVLSYTF